MPNVELSCANGSPFSIQQFRVKESISELFTIEIIARSRSASVDLEGIVGKSASLAVNTGYRGAKGPNGGRRTWSGVCNFIEQVRGVDGDESSPSLSTYLIGVVPALWLLTQRKNYRIYQRLSVPEIVDKLLKEWGLEARWKLDRDAYPRLEYRVQYGETDHAFMSRLLEEAGIAYLLVDVEDRSTLVMTDRPQAMTPRKASVPYQDSPNESAEDEFVTRLRLKHQVKPGARQVVDFDFRRPSFRLKGEAERAPAPEGSYEKYEYSPGAFLVAAKPDGTTPVADDKGAFRSQSDFGAGIAAQRLAAERAGRRRVQFDTNVIDLGPGTVFSIDHHPHPSLGEKLLVVSFDLNAAVEGEWDMVVKALFTSEPYRPLAKTEKPQVQGVQSATVVGPRGQEIHVDEFGRVRVQFPWDREGALDDGSSCWMRVAQGAAGTGFGVLSLPRVGEEVLVGFVNGDPDHPVVVGRVFNAVNPVPYPLPKNKTVSGWRTNSTPKNGGFSEIKIDDAAERELFSMRAERDLHALVRRDRVERVGRNDKHTVDGDRDLVVKKTLREEIGGEAHLRVRDDRVERVDRSLHLSVGGDRREQTGGDQTIAAGETIHINAGTNVVIEAGARLTIQGPGGFIDIHAGGIDISGTLVRLNSGGEAGGAEEARVRRPADAIEASPRDSASDGEG